ncbi:hypothetical protein CLAFUW4_14749 [Fulvia fulva]|uniref:Uncharacterized protein n=1 Tax=Passalora fulva TaxID=5499 RepID=A0A9Q8PMA0_PASFU|nr:uncharacterized protein CLAFUR5_14576 [Fulvia fulva]KAK4608910.1 hypothetical protein CLAFUR4_14741 [Fulvia fulva]KAK4609769.1 hypothetical protein CLAFUR0_14741 [Fulvia fulva]UJO25037.1 hypothetical protein CLAFUR5_14576 [Fulvia fulva]WPV22674.1 hypothetical protein CLAFUW4_14749 [Fulvia fulva]WPV37844.1 hypothetical protein CLAFUW7_14750 [Fulvia fulva]
MSDQKQSSESTPDANNNLLGGDLEKLNALAEGVKARLKGGFGDYYEDGSRGDIRHLQMPKLLHLVEQVEEVNTNLRKLDHASTHSSANNMTGYNSVGSAPGGKATAAQLQVVLERLDKLNEKNTDMEQKVKDAAIKAETAHKHSEATELENESLRKDIARLEGKLKEVGRKAALPPPEHQRLEEKVQGLQDQVQTASSKAKEVTDRFEALQMQVGQASSKADAAAEKADGVRTVVNNASASRDTYRAKQDRVMQSLEARYDGFVSRVRDVEASTQSANSKADSAHSRADAAANKAAKAQAQALANTEAIKKSDAKCASVSRQVQDLQGKVDTVAIEAETASSTAQTAATKAETALNRTTSATIEANKAEAANAVSSTIAAQIAKQEEAVKALEGKCTRFASDIQDVQVYQHTNEETLSSLQSQVDNIKDNITSLSTNSTPQQDNKKYGVMVSDLPKDVTQALVVDYFQASSGPIISSQVIKQKGGTTAFILHFKDARSVSNALAQRATKIDGKLMNILALTNPRSPQELFAKEASAGAGGK